MKHLWLAVFIMTSLCAKADEPDCAHLLAPATREVLQKLDADDFRVKLLTKVYSGQTKLVVLIGEAHRKTPSSAELGRSLHGHFEYFAYERAGSVILGDLLNERIWKPLFGRVKARLLKLSPRTEGSTIEELLSVELTFDETEAIAKAEDVYWRNLVTLSDSVAADEELERIVQVGNRLKEKFLAEKRDRQIWLEENYVPGIREHLWSIPVTRTAVLFLPLKGLLVYAHVPLPSLVSAGVLLTSLVLPIVLDQRPKFSSHPLFPVIFPLYTGREASSDKAMVKNLLQAMERPEITVLPAMVGDAHVPGIERKLFRAGYKQLPLE